MIHETQPFHLCPPCRLAGGPDDLLATGDRFFGLHHGRVKPVNLLAPSTADDDAHVRPAYFRFYVADKKFRQAGCIRQIPNFAHLHDPQKRTALGHHNTTSRFATLKSYRLVMFLCRAAFCADLKQIGQQS